MDVLPAWGVDLNSVSVRAVKLDLDESGKPRVMAWDVIDFTEEVDDVTDLRRFHQMSRGLYHFKSRHELSACRVFVSLRGETAFNRTVVIPPVNDESLDRLLQYEAQQQIPFPLDEVYWDRRVLSIREDGEIVATLYAVRRQLVHERLRKLGKDGFPADGLQIRPLALQNFCSAERLLEPGTVVVDVDYAGLHVLVCHDEHSWFRCLPMGGVDLVERVKQEFSLDHRRAVARVSGHVGVADEGALESCRREVGARVAREAARVVRYYLAARPGVRASNVVLVESHPCVPPLAEALKEELGLPVFKPRGFRHLDVDPEVVTAGIQEYFPGLVKATGLALQGVGKAEVDARLFPPDLQRPLARGRAGYMVAALLLVLLVAWVGIRRGAQARELKERLKALESSMAAGTTPGALREALPLKPHHESLEALAALGEGRSGSLPLVEEIWRVAGERTAAAPRALVVSLRVGAGAGVPPGRAELVLAAVETPDREAAEASMQAVVTALEEGQQVSRARRVSTWIAGDVVGQPPSEPPEGLLRWPLRHNLYHLDVEAGP